MVEGVDGGLHDNRPTHQGDGSGADSRAASTETPTASTALPVDDGAVDKSPAAATATPSAATDLQTRTAAPTPEQLAAYKKAFSDFQDILTELITEAREVTGTPEVTGAPPEDKPGTRGLKNWLSRQYYPVRGFEDLVADYTNILPTLEREDGQAYSQMALLGIKALQKRKLEIAKTVHASLLFLTASSEALKSVLKGLGISVVSLLFIGALPALLIETPYLLDLNVGNIKDYDSAQGMHLYAAFCFGCLGSVVSFLSRLSDFDSKQARSKSFLFAYGLTLPIVGGGSAIVLAAALDAGLISILSNKFQVFIVVGFMAGFSERFTKTLLDKAQDKFGISKSQ